ncbi:hypothetical protein [Streptomyces lavendulae]|uniref:hypothetical protein n=1 Tax=Streptomyces lavendulae TaxID=1914 RepID=UPI0024A0FB3F|nr:hypothetical protein [Streptomyces lavendulae]GLX19560.1 hypothetical protein Slala01_32040 [Streptomyces lavendulae subsp. lavendulae]GLX27055.1 hypothetical protein Slala02_28750 [Streptomyces lavendulae subsp. lavendulae]
MPSRETLHAFLPRTGLTVVEDVRPGSLFPPEAAWRIARGTAAPAGAVREALDAAWWRRLANEDDEFLVAVLGHRIGGNDSWWTRVRSAGDAVPRLTGGPGFAALSLDGQLLLAEVPGADGPRVTALDRLPERLEEAAAAAGHETEAERAEVWAAVPGRPAWPLHWADRIGSNPAAPDELLIRLLDVEDGFLHGCDRPAVLDAAVTHPDPRVRSTPAGTFRPKLTSDQWVRLVRAEPSAARRVLYAERARVWGAELPDDLYAELLAGPARAAAAELPGLPAHCLPALAPDADPRVRAAACARWEELTAPQRDRLLADTDDLVRTEALLAHHTAVPMPREVYAALPDPRRALEQSRLEPGLEADLVRDGTTQERRTLAANPRLGPLGVAVLAEDPDADVRSAVALRPDLDEEQRAAVRHAFDPALMSYTLPWVERLHGDTDAMRRLAASSHPLVRRSVARARHLPPDVVQRLARDEDRPVRLFLAESCDDAPAELLLEVWRWWDGSLSHPDRPRGHPNFPRTGLLRHAADPAGRMRRLALDDPESTPADVARLTRDPEAEVRRRAAEDPRLSPADAVRLLNDPDAAVRGSAVRSPRLPARVLAGLLHDPDTAREAVTNPAIPAPTLHRLLDAAMAH